MKTKQIRALTTLLYTDNSPKKMEYIEQQLQELGLTFTDLFQELQMVDPAAEIFQTDCVSRISAPLHSHPFLEILYSEGSCDADFLVGTSQYRLQPGDILLIPPETRHAVFYSADSNDSFRGYTLWIHPDLIDTLLTHFSYLRQHRNFRNFPFCLHARDFGGSHPEELFKYAAQEAKMHSPGYESALTGIIILLLTNLTRILDHLSLPSDVPEKKELLNQILAHVEEILFQQFTLWDVANHFQISESTLGHLFTKKLGISFYQYVLQRRLSEARSMILDGTPIELASSQVGFRDYSAFYRAFKREYGMSPKQFRLSHSREDD